MILVFHLFIGAVIAAKIGSLPLVIIFALLSHYFLDIFPHNEYLIENIRQKNWKNSKLDFLKLLLDLIAGVISVFFVRYISGINYYLLFSGAIASIFPDILTVLSFIFPDNITLKRHLYFHHEKIHFLKSREYKSIQNGANKKSFFWKDFLSQGLVVLIGLLFLL